MTDRALFSLLRRGPQCVLRAGAVDAMAALGRDYVPRLSRCCNHPPVHFLPETIPFYGSTTTFHLLREHYPDYSYKEAALNPT